MSDANSGYTGPTRLDEMERRKRILRETAMSMREHHPIGHPRHEMWEQFALMMEETAAANVCPDRVLAVCETYLAAVDRPDITSTF